ncbi:hypothetical protein B0H11DRAFT_2217545 [Mycena galericulata]|nr:hypothetical protein B0H11DRAFT_2217545 [Mycena galericulata]
MNQDHRWSNNVFLFCLRLPVQHEVFHRTALVPLVAAVPHALRTVEVTNSTAVISTRDTATAGNVFVCTDAGFTGDCAVFAGANAACVNFSGGFLNDITAIGPDSGASCYFWNGEDCSGEELGPVSSPGISDLNVQATVDFNDHVSSFACFY